MLIFIIHGETVADQIRTWEKHYPLSGLGETQAENIGAELRDIRFDHVYVSPQRSAMETCAVITHMNKYETTVEVIQEIRDRHFGSLAGRPYEAVLSEFPRRKWLEWNRNYYASPPGGESFAEIEDRAKPFLTKLRDEWKEGKTILIVSHLDTTKVLIGFFNQRDEDSICKIELDPVIPYMIPLQISAV